MNIKKILLPIIVIIVTVLSVLFVRVQNEKQAVVDYCRTRMAIIIPVKAVKYRGYSFDHSMNTFYVCYDAKQYYPDLFDKDDETPKINKNFYVEKDDKFSVYQVYITEDFDITS